MYYTAEQIECMEESKNNESATQVYFDLQDFFVAQEKIKYLMTIIPENDLITILDQLTEHFVTTEDYEKCKKISSWRKLLEKSSI
jgi:hypothetical protein